MAATEAEQALLIGGIVGLILLVGLLVLVALVFSKLYKRPVDFTTLPDDDQPKKTKTVKAAKAAKAVKAVKTADKKKSSLKSDSSPPSPKKIVQFDVPSSSSSSTLSEPTPTATTAAVVATMTTAEPVQPPSSAMMNLEKPANAPDLASLPPVSPGSKRYFDPKLGTYVEVSNHTVEIVSSI